MLTSPRTKSKKIFIVEDDVYLRSVLEEYFSNEYQTEAFDNCLVALSSLREGNIPDIIISDLNTPLLDGIGFIEQVRSSSFFSSVPILILSGQENSEIRLKCLESGADDYVVKPFNPYELEMRIKLLLKRVGKPN
jgi:DNA-binding response OmpR family regulator